MFQSPHLILSTMLIILILFLTFFALEKNKIKYSFSAGVLALILFQFHPFHVPTIFGVLGAYVLIKFIIDRKINYNYIKHLLILFILSFPSILYWLLLQNYDFITQIRSYQNVCLTPSWWVTLFSYGFILVLAIFGVYKIISLKKFSNQNIFLIVWLTVHFAMLYSPFNFQRRLMQGLQIPMILLAVIGLYYIYKYLGEKMSRKRFDFWVNNKFLLIIIFILLFGSSHIYNWVREISVFADIYPQLYIRNDHLAGYEWLKNNTGRNDAIMTDLYNGNLIPGRIGHQVFIGHGVETIFFNSKFNQMVWFYLTNGADDKKQKFLEDNNIDYIFYGSNEKSIGNFQQIGRAHV